MPTRLTRVARLEALEKVAAAQRARQESQQPRDERWEAAWQILFSTMSEEHVRLVLDAYELSQSVSPLEYRDDASARLLRRCKDAVSRVIYAHWPHSEIPPEIVLAMPLEVAEVYMCDSGALPLHECEACGYKVPHRYFDSCPLCSARVGWYAYWSRRTGQRV